MNDDRPAVAQDRDGVTLLGLRIDTIGEGFRNRDDWTGHDTAHRHIGRRNGPAGR